jgi:hypothetical protein
LDAGLLEEERGAIVLDRDSQGRTPPHLAFLKAENFHPSKPETVVVLLANDLACLIGTEIYHHESHELQFWWQRLEYVLELDDSSSNGPLHLFLRLEWLGVERQLRRSYERLLSLFGDDVSACALSSVLNTTGRAPKNFAGRRRTRISTTVLCALCITGTCKIYHFVDICSGYK